LREEVKYRRKLFYAGGAVLAATALYYVYHK
jgi:hypothetical protein